MRGRARRQEGGAPAPQPLSAAARSQRVSRPHFCLCVASAVFTSRRAWELGAFAQPDGTIQILTGLKMMFLQIDFQRSRDILMVWAGERSLVTFVCSFLPRATPPSFRNPIAGGLLLNLGQPLTL